MHDYFNKIYKHIYLLTYGIMLCTLFFNHTSFLNQNIVDIVPCQHVKLIFICTDCTRFTVWLHYNLLLSLLMDVYTFSIFLLCKSCCYYLLKIVLKCFRLAVGWCYFSSFAYPRHISNRKCFSLPTRSVPSTTKVFPSLKISPSSRLVSSRLFSVPD